MAYASQVSAMFVPCCIFDTNPSAVLLACLADEPFLTLPEKQKRYKVYTDPAPPPPQIPFLIIAFSPSVITAFLAVLGKHTEVLRLGWISQ